MFCKMSKQHLVQTVKNKILIVDHHTTRAFLPKIIQYLKRFLLSLSLSLSEAIHFHQSYPIFTHLGLAKVDRSLIY